ncbi:MAG: HU family DNA-binding protein [Paludibacteraceae bacterium]|nr:HU family DNA-binding protein [Paludibacteraceae bacterium]
MTKAELVSEVSLRTGYSKSDILQILEATGAVISDTMAGGENVYLRGFGTFFNKTRAQKTARDILRKTSVIVPEHQIPAFKGAADFMAKYNK